MILDFFLPYNLCNPAPPGAATGGVMVTPRMEILVRVAPVSFSHVAENITKWYR